MSGSNEADKTVIQAEKIAQYYDSNTRKFLLFGGAGKTSAIHRAIWAPHVRDADEAFEFLNRLITNAVAPVLNKHSNQPRVLDLGCGVGGTAFYIANALDVSVTGVTISSTQCDLAIKKTRELNLGNKLHFITADFESLPALPFYDAIYAIESFVHARDAAAFMTMASAQLLTGGRMVICDDFAHAQPSTEAQRWIMRFKHGWHLNSVLSVEQTCRLAQRAGFRLVEQQDLSPYLKQFPAPFLWLLTHLTRIPLPWAYWSNLAGGTALQRCVQKGWTQYHALVFEKV